MTPSSEDYDSTEVFVPNATYKDPDTGQVVKGPAIMPQWMADLMEELDRD